MKTTHTPAALEYSLSPANWLLVSDGANMRAIADCDDEKDARELIRRANAYPDLLATCKAMIEELDETGRVRASSVHVRSARAAIARAEGGAA